MVMATLKAHADKPIWVTAGGAELPVTNIAIALALALGGPGRYSLDRAFGIRLPWSVVALAAAAATAGLFKGATSEPAPEMAEREAGSQLQAESTTAS